MFPAAQWTATDDWPQRFDLRQSNREAEHGVAANQILSSENCEANGQDVWSHPQELTLSSASARSFVDLPDQPPCCLTALREEIPASTRPNHGITAARDQGTNFFWPTSRTTPASST